MRTRSPGRGPGLGEQVDIGGHSVQEAVSLNRVTACQGEAVRSGCVERDASEPLVKWVHGEIGQRPLSGKPQVGKPFFPRPPPTSGQVQLVPDLAENLLVKVGAQVLGSGRLPDHALVHHVPLGWVIETELRPL